MEPVMPGAAIVFDHVGKTFRYFASPFQRVKEALHPARKLYHTPLPVLRDVSFFIPRGQTVAVLGANGAGKSTLLHLAAGLLEPSSGAVRASGSVFGLLDLSGGFHPELTGRENVRFFHDVVLQGAGDKCERERVVQAFAEIGEHFDRPLRTYSSGMFLRLAFATAISAEPDVLLIDEVIAVGDARFQHKCYSRIRELRDRGTTVVLVTHAVEMVPALCDRVLLFDGGDLVFDGDPATGVERYYQQFFMVPARLTFDTSLHTRRYGVGGATIHKYFASRDGVSEAPRFQRGERVKIVLEVDFERAVLQPHFGFSCSTKQGLRLYATTTATQTKGPAPACAGERRRVEIEFAVSVVVEDVFVDLSVFELDHGSIVVLDAHLGLLQLTVTSSTYCEGVIDLGAAFTESTVDAA
jgi:ABC-type polysaccharide/polyol phosphate transport system ATPase subunit